MIYPYLPLVLLAAIQGSRGHRYALTDEVIGEEFFLKFTHEAINDPTHGRVEYVSERTARHLNLSYASEDHFIMRADFTTRLHSGSPRGRKSVRIQSKLEYSHGTVIVADIDHMPEGCGTWPALWTCGDNWPYGGEVDLIEGVNNMSPNSISLHTSEGCTQPESRAQTGTPTTNDCNAFVNYNTGCGVKLRDETSYGPSFNENGGGWYALERTREEIKAWFWPRNSPHVPHDIRRRHHHSRGRFQSPIAGIVDWELEAGSNIVHHPDTIIIDTSKWGLPSARFVNDHCDIPGHFKGEKLIINLTFCGDWAGEFFTYLKSGCPSTCEDYVNSNPDAFVNAYWDIRSVRFYGLPGDLEIEQDRL